METFFDNEQLNIKFRLEPTWFNNAPNIKVCVGEQILLDTQLDTVLEYNHSIKLAAEADHQLTFTLYNKTKYDTVVKDGIIEKDTLIKISKIQIEDVDITTMITLDNEKFYYEHDNNGSTALEKHTFYDTLGCNGTATINFTTPFYVWLLENL